MKDNVMQDKSKFYPKKETLPPYVQLVDFERNALQMKKSAALITQRPTLYSLLLHFLQLRLALLGTNMQIQN